MTKWVARVCDPERDASGAECHRGGPATYYRGGRGGAMAIAATASIATIGPTIGVGALARAPGITPDEEIPVQLGATTLQPASAKQSTAA